MMEIEKEYASKGVAGAGLGLGIAGTALGLLNGNGGFAFPWMNGNNHPVGCSENMPVSRYELGQESKIADLQAQIALRDANTYGDQKLLEVYKYFDGKLAAVGKHDELYETCPAYRKMVDLQKLEEEGGAHNG